MSQRLALFVVLLACCSETFLPSPTVRVDLRHRMPEKELRRLLLADTTFECRRRATVETAGASQRFIVTYKVFQGECDRRYITAVQVEPDGPFSGARGPVASAVVSDGNGRKVPVQITWEATRGCSTVTAGVRVELVPDDPTCKPPRPAGKIFK